MATRVTVLDLLKSFDKKELILKVAIQSLC